MSYKILPTQKAKPGDPNPPVYFHHEDFEEYLTQVVKDIREAEFLAFDGEFTGLNDGVLGILDTPSDRYAKIRTCVNYLLVQFGLVAFFKTEDGYTHRAYNFALWGGAPRKFTSNTESLELITSSGLSLDKVIKEGIPYLNMQEEEKLRSKVEEWQKYREAEIRSSQDSDSAPSAIPMDQSEFISEVFVKVKAFVDSDRSELVIENSTGFQRKLLFQHLRHKYEDLLLESKAVDGNVGRVMVITKQKREEQVKLLAKAVEDKQEEIDRKSGFSKVIRAISESGKLLVGHNMALDCIHVLHQFVSSAPLNYDDFKLLLKDTFKRFIDTKVVATASPLPSVIPESILPTIAGLMKQGTLPTPKLKDPPPGEGFSLSDDQLHNAAFDAYLTGVIFLSMMEHLANVAGSSLSSKLKNGISSFPLVEPYLNKIFVMKSNDIRYMNIGGPELEVDRSHVFHLTFPKEWKTPNILNLCKSLGYVQIEWVDVSSAFVILNDKSKKNEFISAIEANPTSQRVRVTPYAEYRRREAQTPTGRRSPTDFKSPRGQKRDFRRQADEAVREAKKRKEDDDNTEMAAPQEKNKTPETGLSQVFETPDW